MIFCCSLHRVSIFEMHTASRMVFGMVLDSHGGHFFSGIHSVISDGDRLRY